MCGEWGVNVSQRTDELSGVGGRQGGGSTEDSRWECFTFQDPQYRLSGPEKTANDS